MEVNESFVSGEMYVCVSMKWRKSRRDLTPSVKRIDETVNVNNKNGRSMIFLVRQFK